MSDEAPRPRGTPVVLLVDDEPLLLESLGHELKETFKLFTATSASEADLRLAAGKTERWNDVLSSITEAVKAELPQGDKNALLALAGRWYDTKLARPDTAVHAFQQVLVTGYMKPEMLIRSVNEAALFRYLLKPVTLAELIKVVQEAVKSDAPKGA